MVSHQISIRDDVYQKLKKLKKDDESFSDLIDRLSCKVKSTQETLEDLNGIAGSDDLEIKKLIIENRTMFEKNFQKRLKIDK